MSLARQHVRACLVDVGVDGQPDLRFPDWATQPIPNSLINLADTWISSGWPEQRRILTTPDHPVDRNELRALAAIHCEGPALRQWLELLDAADRAGMSAVVADMHTAHAALDLINAWITTPSWNASQAFFATHPELRGPDITDALEQLSGNPTMGQHLAILRLTEHTPAGAVFDAILDPNDAHDLLFAVARRGNADDLAEVWYAVPPSPTTRSWRHSPTRSTWHSATTPTPGSARSTRPPRP